MGKRVIGIDIGAGSVKLVELEKSPEGIHLLRAKFFDFSHLPEPEKKETFIREGLDGLLKAEKIKGEKSAVCLSGQAAFVRFLKLPRVQKSKKEKIIVYEAQQQVPFPLDKIVWDYQTFRFTDGPEEDVLLVAIKREIVEASLGYLARSDLDIEFVDISPFALFNAMEYNGPMEQGIILDIGAKATNLMITEEKRFWVRSILIGGDEMTQAISSKLKIPFDKAEELKRREGAILSGGTLVASDLTPAGRDTSNILDPVLSDLVSAVVQSLEYHRTQSGREAAFKEVILCGGGSKLRGIEDYLAKNLGMQISRSNLTKKIKCASNLRLDMDFQARFGAAIGLALRFLHKCPLNIDLLPAERKVERDFRKKRNYVIASGLILALIPFTLGLYVSSQSQALKARLAYLNDLLSKYEVVQKKISSLNKEITTTKAKMRPFEETVVKRTLWLEALLKIEKLLPPDAWITVLKTEKDFMVMEGQTTSTLLAITELKNRLATSKLFESVEILYASLPKETKGGESQIRNFSIKFKLSAGLIEEEPSSEGQGAPAPKETQENKEGGR